MDTFEISGDSLSIISWGYMKGGGVMTSREKSLFIIIILLFILVFVILSKEQKSK